MDWFENIAIGSTELVSKIVNGKTDKVSRKTKQKQVKGTKTNLKIFRLLLSVSVWQYESKNVLENNKIRP